MTAASILEGDVRETLRSLPAGHFHCVVTSPPFWGLRSYLKSDHPLKPLELGGEPTIEKYLENLLGVFEEVRRVLRDDGLCFVELGDSYNGSGEKKLQINSPKQMTNRGGISQRGTNVPDLKPGDKCGIPERFALAMQAAGWWWRQTIVWAKLSPMPESVSGWTWRRHRIKIAKCERAANEARSGDLAKQSAAVASRAEREAHDLTKNWRDCPGCEKCEKNNGLVLHRGRGRYTNAHSYIFQFANSAGYFYDQVATLEDCEPATLAREKYTRVLDDPDEQFAVRHDHESFSNGKRNPRSWFAIGHEPLKEAHYAAFPSEIPRRAIQAATSIHGCCRKCGGCWTRVVDKSVHGSWHNHENDDEQGAGQNGPERNKIMRDGRYRQESVGFRPACDCAMPPAEPVPCRVLDPFGGSGTVALEAIRLGCEATICELNPDYVAIARKRLAEEMPLLISQPKGDVECPKSPQSSEPQERA